MYFGKGSVLKAFIERNIPQDMWYATSHNGITRIAPARLVELEINPIRKSQPSGPPMPYFKILTRQYSQALNFSDRTEGICVDGNGRGVRQHDGISGSIKEFEQFCFKFPVVPGPAIWIPCQERLRVAEGSPLGRLGDQTDFWRILDLAQTFLDSANEQLKD